MRRRTIGLVLVAVGFVGLAGTAWVFAARPSRPPGPMMWPRAAALVPSTTCATPSLPGQIVDVVLADMGGTGGGMMASGRMMSVQANPSSVAAGDVSFRVWNAGMMVHELVVLPLDQHRVGTRFVGSDDRVSEAGSLGEASRSCGEGAGEGLVPRSEGWVALQLPPGRYELICNLPGHYAMGMFTELDVR